MRLLITGKTGVDLNIFSLTQTSESKNYYRSNRNCQLKKNAVIYLAASKESESYDITNTRDYFVTACIISYFYQQYKMSALKESSLTNLIGLSKNLSKTY